MMAAATQNVLVESWPLVETPQLFVRYVRPARVPGHGRRQSTRDSSLPRGYPRLLAQRDVPAGYRMHGVGYQT